MSGKSRIVSDTCNVNSVKPSSCFYALHLALDPLKMKVFRQF